MGCSYEYAYPPREVLFTILLEKRVEYAIIVTNKKYVEPDCEGAVFVLLSGVNSNVFIYMTENRRNGGTNDVRGL